MVGNQLSDKFVGLAAGRAVSDCHERGVVFFRQICKDFNGSLPFVSRLMRENRTGFQDGARLGNHGNFHAGTNTRIQTDYGFVPGRRREQKVFEVGSEDFDSRLLRSIAKTREQIAF